MRSGILVINKPGGPSSATVVAQVRRITGIRRIGHGGTLDPGATGVLVLGVNRGTALLPYLPGVKRYLGRVCLGQTTDTDDAQGRRLETKAVPFLDRDRLEAVLAGFCGEISQVPPAVSALHCQGQRAYKLAHRGIVPVLPPRRVFIHHLRLLEWKSPEFWLDVKCSPGTYIRSLAAGIGTRLGCGAHLAGLTRTECGGFALDQAVSLEALADGGGPEGWIRRLHPPAEALRHLPALRIEGTRLEFAKHGRAFAAEPGGSVADAPGPVRLLDGRGELIALAVLRGGQWRMETVLCPAGEEPCE